MNLSETEFAGKREVSPFRSILKFLNQMVQSNFTTCEKLKFISAVEVFRLKSRLNRQAFRCDALCRAKLYKLKR